MKFEKQFRALMLKLEEKHGRLFWIKCTSVYPLNFQMPEEKRASCCKSYWTRGEAAISHAEGYPHFRQFVTEHPDVAAKLWGEEVRQLAAEVLLSGVEVPA